MRTHATCLGAAARSVCQAGVGQHGVGRPAVGLRRTRSTRPRPAIRCRWWTACCAPSRWWWPTATAAAADPARPTARSSPCSRRARARIRPAAAGSSRIPAGDRHSCSSTTFAPATASTTLAIPTSSTINDTSRKPVGHRAHARRRWGAAEPPDPAVAAERRRPRIVRPRVVVTARRCGLTSSQPVAAAASAVSRSSVRRFADPSRRRRLKAERREFRSAATESGGPTNSNPSRRGPASHLHADRLQRAPDLASAASRAVAVECSRRIRPSTGSDRVQRGAGRGVEHRDVARVVAADGDRDQALGAVERIDLGGAPRWRSDRTLAVVAPENITPTRS